MVERVTNRAMQNTALNNIFRITDDLAKTQNEITTGKRISRLSDDPSGIHQTLQLRTSVDQIKQYVRNIDFNQVTLASSDSALSDIGTGITRARELAVSQLNGVATAQTRQYTAAEIDKIISLALQSANTKVKSQYIFAGTNFTSPPFSAAASGAVYTGNTESAQIEIANGYKVSLGLTGAQVLGTDLNPALSNATLLSSLNGGAGIPAGSFTLTSRGGKSATINVAAGMSVGALLNAINSAGINVTASINGKQNAIVLTDSSPVVTQALTVAEVGGGNTAAKLGIAGQRDGSLEGTDVNPALSASTLLSQLNGGNGLSLTSVNIVNGNASGAVTLSSAATIGDVINSINNSGLNVTASVNGAGNSLRVASNSASTVAVVVEVGTGTSAQDLGIGGGRNVLTNLVNLRDALNKNDQQAIVALLGNLDQSQASVLNGRASIGAVLTQVNSTNTTNSQNEVAMTNQISNIEDSDFTRAAAHLAQLQVALEATLNTTARIIQPSLLDFLR